MPAIEWKPLLKEIEDEAVAAAKAHAGDYAKEAAEDAKAFVVASKNLLVTLTESFLMGKLTKEEYQFSLKGLKDLAELEALAQAGLAVEKAAGTRDALGAILAKLVINAVDKAIKP